MVRPDGEEEYKRARSAMLAEARTLSRVKHPGVVTVHSVFIDKETNSLFIEMDWLEGPTLETRMSQGPVSHEQARDWLHAILRALEKVHEKRITHRDIKLANIVFDEDDNPVLVDFGAALNRETKDGMTVAGPYTPQYAAPEQQIPRMGKIGPWTDFYALAATWYELLTMRPVSEFRGVVDSGNVTDNKELIGSVMKNL